jgi:hypothetical protein
VEKLTRRMALRRILTAAGGLAAGSAMVGCFPGPGSSSYYANYSYGGGGSSYDNYAHRYIVGGQGTGPGYIHYGDGH